MHNTIVKELTASTNTLPHVLAVVLLQASMDTTVKIFMTSTGTDD
jgi:hypothetical protein